MTSLPPIVQTDSVEPAWQRLRRHVDWAGSFWLGLLFSNDPRTIDRLRDRMEWHRKSRARRFVHLRVAEPFEFRSLIRRLEELDGDSGSCVWIDASGGASAEWRDGWIMFFGALNHRRDVLRRQLGGLVIAAPAHVLAQARTVSTDLWSVRDFFSVVEPILDDPPRSGGDLDLGLLFTEHSGSLSGRVESVPMRFEPSATARLTLALLAASDKDLRTRRKDELAQLVEVLRSDPDSADEFASLALRRAELYADDPARRREDLQAVVDSTARDRLRYVALGELIDLAISDHQFHVARDLARRALYIAERLVGAVGRAQAEFDVSLSLIRLGGVQERLGDLVGAQESYFRSLEIRKRLAETNGRTEAERGVAFAQERLGWVQGRLGDLVGARESYLRSLAITERLVEVLGGPLAERDVAFALMRLGWVQERSGDLVGARESYQRSLGIAQRLVEVEDGSLAEQVLSTAAANLRRLEGKSSPPRVSDGEKSAPSNA